MMNFTNSVAGPHGRYFTWRTPGYAKSCALRQAQGGPGTASSSPQRLRRARLPRRSEAMRGAAGFSGFRKLLTPTGWYIIAQPHRAGLIKEKEIFRVPYTRGQNPGLCCCTPSGCPEQPNYAVCYQYFRNVTRSHAWSLFRGEIGFVW
jgi:hypothetical protein